MMIDLNKELLNLKDQTLKVNNEKLVVGKVIIDSLTVMTNNEQCDADQKLCRYKLAKKISESWGKSGEIELSDSELNIVKNRIGILFTPIIVGFMFDVLKGD